MSVFLRINIVHNIKHMKRSIWIGGIVALVSIGVLFSSGGVHAQPAQSCYPPHQYSPTGVYQSAQVYFKRIERQPTETLCTCEARLSFTPCDLQFQSSMYSESLYTWSASCDLPCGATDGAGTAYTRAEYIQSPLYVPTGGYTDTPYSCAQVPRQEDLDGDYIPADQDQNDLDFRVGVLAGSMDGCDGVDNDNDVCNEEGSFFQNHSTGQCLAHQKDYRRLWANGHEAPEGQVNLREGWLLRAETDATIEGPYGQLGFTRYYNSAANWDLVTLGGNAGGVHNPVGRSMTHNFHIWLAKDSMQMLGTSAHRNYTLRTGDGTEYYYSCIEDQSGAVGTTGNWDCYPHERFTSLHYQHEIDDTHLQRRTVNVGEDVVTRWEFYPGNGSAYYFSPGENDEDLDFTRAESLYDVTQDALVWRAEYDNVDRLEYVRTANDDTYFRFSYNNYDQIEDVYVHVDNYLLTPGEQHAVHYAYDTYSSLLETATYAKDTIGSVDPDVKREYVYDGTNRLTTVKDNLDSTTQVDTMNVTWHNPPVGTLESKVASMRGANMWAEFDYTSDETEVTYKDTSGDMTVTFTHDGGKYVYKRDKEYHRSSIPRYIERDNFGRPSCVMDDSGVMTKYLYTQFGVQWAGIQRHVTVGDFGTTGHCDNQPAQDPLEPNMSNANGTLQRTYWSGEIFDVKSNSWRSWYSSQRSPASNYTATDCQVSGTGNGGAVIPHGCIATVRKYADANATYEVQGPLEKIQSHYYTNKPGQGPVEEIVETEYVRGGTCFTDDPNYKYDWQVCRVEQKDSFGNLLGQTRIDYDTNGLLEYIEDFASASVSYETKVLGRDMLGRVSKDIGPTSIVTDLTYDALGGMTDRTVLRAFRDESGNDLSYTQSVSTNNIGAPTEIVSTLGQKTVYKYNTGLQSYGRLGGVVINAPNGVSLAASRFDYNDQGMLEQSHAVDIANEPSCSDETCATTAARSYTNYDAVGRPLTSYSFTNDTSMPADATAVYVYDPQTGQIDTYTDFEGNVTDYQYDVQGRLEEVTRDINGFSAEQNNEYNDLNNPEQTTSPNGVETDYEYDDNGRMTKQSSNTSGDQYFEYDLVGNLTRTIHVDKWQPITHADRKEVCYSYDWLGRMTGVDERCNGTDDWTFVYDESFSWCDGGDPYTNEGRMTSMISNDPAGMHRKWCYYPNGAVEKEFTSPGNVFWDDPETYTSYGYVLPAGTQYVYDQAGRLTKKYVNTFPHGHDLGTREISYDYDTERVTNLAYIKTRLYGYLGWGAWQDVTSPTTLPKYSVYGLEELTLANGLTLTYDHDVAGQVEATTLGDGVNANIIDSFRSYDANFNILEDIDSGYLGKAREFKYDSLNRLTCEAGYLGDCPENSSQPVVGTSVEVSFEHDLSNNRLMRRTATPWNVQEYVHQTGSDRIEKYYDMNNLQYVWYDNQGNIEAVNYPQPNEDHVYEWNTHNQMIEACNDATYPQNGTNCSMNSYEYAGPGGQLFARYTGNGGGFGRDTGDREFYWSGHQVDLIKEFDDAGANDDNEHLDYYIWFDGMPIAKAEARKEQVGASGYTVYDDGITWIHTDYLGAPVLATDDNANVVWEWDRTVYGRNLPSGSVEIDLRLPGMIYDEKADAFYNQHRWYSPYLGQYLSIDPIGLAGSHNYYGYANANPTNYVDLNGLEPTRREEVVFKPHWFPPAPPRPTFDPNPLDTPYTKTQGTGSSVYIPYGSPIPPTHGTANIDAPSGVRGTVPVGGAPGSIAPKTHEERRCRDGFNLCIQCCQQRLPGSFYGVCETACSIEEQLCLKVGYPNLLKRTHIDSFSSCWPGGRIKVPQRDLSPRTFFEIEEWMIPQDPPFIILPILPPKAATPSGGLAPATASGFLPFIGPFKYYQWVVEEMTRQRTRG